MTEPASKLSVISWSFDPMKHPWTCIPVGPSGSVSVTLIACNVFVRIPDASTAISSSKRSPTLTVGSSFLCHPPFAVCHAVSPILGTSKVDALAEPCRAAIDNKPPRTARCSQCAQARWSSSTSGSGGTGVSEARTRTALRRWRNAATSTARPT